MRQRTKYRKEGSRSRSKDPIYHTPADFENELLYGSLYPSQRYYIDPWDLENYDYVRKQISISPEISTPSPAGEPMPSAFHYMTNNTNSPVDCPACCAGFDEQTFYNAKYETIPDDEPVYSSYGEFESRSSPDSRSSYVDSGSSAALRLHTPGFGPASGRRRLVLPKPPPQLEFPAPPSYDYCIPMSENNYCSLSECYDCLSENIPLYASSTYRSGRSSFYKPHRFGLSKKGLLQIDYSCNWNDLDRLITK
ncbi:uncharacterized protein LOC119655984 [Hermetia illucens]|nr:uncharacterized protein LOC119655984 [Hermetia illucens]XP_037918150.1 uncharacterized protein LOC119655984 [Hermetia illucens]